MSTLNYERTVQAPPHIVWQVISDLEGYADIAPNISKAQVLSGQGQGAIRRCWDPKGQSWNETCTLWDEGRAYTMVVDTTAPDYPYPINHLQGTWGMEETEDGVRITMQFDFEVKYGMVGRAMTALVLKRQFNKICAELLDNWEREIANRSTQST